MDTITLFNQKLLTLINQEAHLAAGVFFKENHKPNRHGQITIINKQDDPSPYYFDHTIQSGVFSLIAYKDDVITLAKEFNYNIEPILNAINEGCTTAKNKYPH
jgi:hypothetical protein